MKIIQLINNFKYLFYVRQNILFDKSSNKVQNYIVNKKIRKLVKKAYTLPYYKKNWDKFGINIKDIKTKDDLKLLPELDKSEVSKNYKQFLITNKGFKFETSGSSGKPVTIIYSANALIKLLSYNFRERNIIKKLGYKKKAFVVRPISDGQTSNKLEKYLRKILWIPSRLEKAKQEYISILLPIKKIYNQIQKEKIEIIGTYGSFVEEFYNYCKINNLKPKYPKIFNYASDSCSKKTIEGLLKRGIKTIATYNCVECQVIGYQKNPLENYSVHKNAVMVITNKKNEVLITPLYNDAMILINYNLGDEIQIKRDMITEVVGRVYHLVNDNGKIFPSVLLDPAFTHEGILRYQLIQKKNKTLIINVICKKEYQEINRKKIIKFLKKLNFNKVKVNFVEELIREKNGKVLLVKQE